MTTLTGGGGTTIYIRQDPQTLAFSSSTDQTNWNDLDFSTSISVQNTNTAAGVLVIEFTTDLVLTDALQYFVCASSHIQFGSKSLRQDGTRPRITVYGVTDYPGFIQNGTAVASGAAFIYVYNLYVDGTTSTLVNAQGWIAQSYFSRQVSNNYIINCSSDGTISVGSGGIVGEYAGGNGGDLNITGCSSSGLISIAGGGIAGGYAGFNTGTTRCFKCWTTGAVDGNYAGGIFGLYAGRLNGFAYATNCYSDGGVFGIAAGGIFGQNAGYEEGVVVADTCYSTGTVIGTNAGGIFGGAAGSGNTQTTVTVINCYCLNGPILAPGAGLNTSNNTYTANGTWSSTAASGALLDTYWIEPQVNSPFEFAIMGYTPYILEIIAPNGETLVDGVRLSAVAGSATSSAIVSNLDYQIISVTPPEATIQIDAVTGSIQTSAATPAGQYTVVVRNIGSYNVTTNTLRVTSAPTPPTPSTGTQNNAYIAVVAVSVVALILFLALLS